MTMDNVRQPIIFKIHISLSMIVLLDESTHTSINQACRHISSSQKDESITNIIWASWSICSRSGIANGSCNCHKISSSRFPLLSVASLSALINSYNVQRYMTWVQIQVHLYCHHVHSLNLHFFHDLGENSTACTAAIHITTYHLPCYTTHNYTSPPMLALHQVAKFLRIS